MFLAVSREAGSQQTEKNSEEQSAAAVTERKIKSRRAVRDLVTEGSARHTVRTDFQKKAAKDKQESRDDQKQESSPVRLLHRDHQPFAT